ncbi:hypothetical protein Agub_g4730, partial [Astrephomene gubernaculifera]
MQGSFGSFNGRGSMNGGGSGSARTSFGSGGGRASGSGRKVQLCSNCETPLSQDEMLLSSQTEGRCVACQQLVEAQSACRVCHLPWSNNHTNVVACDSCGFYMHENCVKKGALQTKSGGRLYTYCPHCPPTLPPPSAAAPGGRGSDAGGSSLVKTERAGRQSQSSLPLSASLAAQQQQQAAAAAAAAAAVLPSGGRGGLAASAALALPAQPQAQLQQVAVLLQGQLRMLQTQQAALLRQYEQQLRAVTPAAAPTAFSLFQLDMFRVYQEEGFEIDPLELHPIIQNAWHQLTTDERAGYDSRAAAEAAVWTASAQLYAQLYHEYETLAGQVGVPPDPSLLPKSMQGMLVAVRQLAGPGRPLAGPG